ncbi:yjeF N-terminal domain-containing protein 3 isoform 5-T5 [Geothlypis trichas]
MSSAPCPSREPPRYLSQAEAEAMEKELLEDYRFGRQQLIEIWGHACAVAVTKDYEPTIFYPKRSPDPLHRDFTTQCEKMDIPFLSYLPAEVQLINDAYNAVVDAVLGAEGTQGTEGTEPCAAILATLRHVRIPIVSLDVPSGAARVPRVPSDVSGCPPCPLGLPALLSPWRCHPGTLLWWRWRGWGHPRTPPRWRWRGWGHPQEITKCPAQT